MEWNDEAVVLGVRKHGETSVIAELMTLERGRHLGLVQGGRSRSMRPVLQPGNSVRATWRARLDEHLGQYRLEGERLKLRGYLGIPLLGKTETWTRTDGDDVEFCAARVAG